MFERFEEVVHGKSPIGCENGIWGRLSGYWYQLNANTSPAMELRITPAMVSPDPLLVGTLGRSGMENFARTLVQFAQNKGSWAAFTAEDVHCTAHDLDFWVDCGWLVKRDNSYDFTMGFVMLVLSHS